MLFAQPAVDGRLDHCPFLATVNDVGMNMVHKCFVRTSAFISLG